MFGHSHYVPILKWKQGEYRGLATVDAKTKRFLTPVIELLEPGDREGLKRAFRQVERAWGNERPFFLDLYYCGEQQIEPEEVEEDEEEDAEIVAAAAYDEATKMGLPFIPVISPSYTEAEIQVAMKYTDRGLCIRLRNDDFDSDELTKDVRQFVREIGLSVNQVDVIADFESLDMTSSQACKLAVPVLRELMSAGKWRTVTLCATSFPHTMQGIPTGSVSAIERKAWLVWKRVLSSSKLPRLPSFGDYGIQHPELVEYDPRTMQASATIRYALDEEWLLVRGYGLKARGKGGFKQFKFLSDQLRKLPQFYGPQHCAGCSLINDIADRNDRFGNLGTWRGIGTCHHLTVTTQAIARLSGV